MDALQAYTPGSDFDFGAFLRDDTLDMDVVLPDRSTGTEEGASSTSPTDSSSQPGGGGEMVRAASGRRHERRGHTKSRRGCFNCKRRRIKVGGLSHTTVPSGRKGARWKRAKGEKGKREE